MKLELGNRKGKKLITSMAVTLLVIVGKNMIALFSRHVSVLRHLLKASALNDDRSLKCRADPLSKVGTCCLSGSGPRVTFDCLGRQRTHDSTVVQRGDVVYPFLKKPLENYFNSLMTS